MRLLCVEVHDENILTRIAADNHEKQYPVVYDVHTRQQIGNEPNGKVKFHDERYLYSDRGKNSPCFAGLNGELVVAGSRE